MTNLVTNGAFTTDTTGWTGTNATLAVVASDLSGNALEVTNSSATYGNATQDITTVVGVAYYLSYAFKRGTGAQGQVYLGTVASESLYYTSGATLTNTDWVMVRVSFTATTTTTRIKLWVNTVISGNTAIFDSIVIESATDAAQASAKNKAVRNYQVMYAPIAFNTRKTTANLVRKIPYWLGLTGTALYSIDMSGVYSGTIVVGSGNVKDTKITILDKASKTVVAMTRPDANGNFSFTGLDKTTVNGYLAFDEVSGTFNAIVYDKLVFN